MATYNGVARHGVEAECQLPNGEKLIRGTIQMGDNYYTGGDLVNLSNYFANAPISLVAGSANGWTLQWNAAAYGSPFAGKVKVYGTIGNAIGLGIATEVAANADLSTVNAVFFAIGKSK